jgi:hypothetical protein
MYILTSRQIFPDQLGFRSSIRNIYVHIVKLVELLRQVRSSIKNSQENYSIYFEATLIIR